MAVRRRREEGPTALPARGKRDCEGETILDKGVVAKKDRKAFRTNRVEVAADYLVADSYDLRLLMKDALDLDGVYDAIRNAAFVNCFVKCAADHRGTLRGRRQIMLDDSDVHHHRHAKAAVGAVVAAAIGDPAVFVSVGAMHQGPHGGGPVIAIVDVGE